MEEGGPGGGAFRISCSTNDKPSLFSFCCLSVVCPSVSLLFLLFHSILRCSLRFHSFSAFCPVVPVSV